MGQHDIQLRNLKECNQATAGQISQISNKLNKILSLFAQWSTSAQSNQPASPDPSLQPPQIAHPLREAHVPDPEPYSSDLGKCTTSVL